MGPAGIVDEDVDIAERGGRPCDRLFHLLARGDVGGQRQRVGPDFARYPLGRVATQVENADLRALGGEKPGDALPEAATRAGNDGDLACQTALMCSHGFLLQSCLMTMAPEGLLVSCAENP